MEGQIMKHGTSHLAILAGLLIAMLAIPASATNESQAAILGLLYRPGAREMALGGAGVASAKGSVASYYNPALLSWQTSEDGTTYRRSLGTTYYKILQNFNLNDMYYMYFPVVFNVPDWGQFAVNFTYLSLGEQERTDESGTLMGTFATYTLVVGGSYSSKISDDASAGITAKWFYDHLADFGQGQERGEPTGTGFALDAGIAYHYSPSLTFGAALRNYGPNVQYIDANQASPTPINFNIGTEWKAIDTEYNDITVVADIYKPLVQDYRKNWLLAPVRAWFDEDVYKVDPPTGETEEKIYRSTWKEESRQVDIHAGVEYSYAEYVALRTGYYRDWDGQRNWATFGAGFRLPIATALLKIDFAYVSALTDGSEDPNDGQQIYSVGITF
jgi:hypothetical protein